MATQLKKSMREETETLSLQCANCRQTAKGVNGFLPSEASRANYSGGKVLKEGATNPLPASKGVWEAMLGPPAGSGAAQRFSATPRSPGSSFGCAIK